jgi:hypothetical protein
LFPDGGIYYGNTKLVGVFVTGRGEFMECPRCRIENPPTAEICDCGYCFNDNKVHWVKNNFETKNKTVNDGNNARSTARTIGLIFIFAGLITAAFFTLIYDTSIAVPRTTADSVGNQQISEMMPNRVNNLGKLQERQNGILGGIGISILGSIIMLYGKE